MSNILTSLDNLDDQGSLDKDLIDLNKKLFNPYRILILKILNHASVAEFNQLKHSLDISDGNLASHLRSLIKADLIVKQKEIVDNSPKTYYSLTKNGRDEYRKFKTIMKGVLK